MTDIVYIDRISYTRETLRIKNMMCECCLRVVKEELEAVGLIVESIVGSIDILGGVIFFMHKFWQV